MLKPKHMHILSSKNLMLLKVNGANSQMWKHSLSSVMKI